MLLGKHESLKIEIKEIKLESAKSVKLLGVTIDHNLTFDAHVLNICKAAGPKIKSLSGIRNTMDEKQAKLLFNSFILLQVNFCSILWMFIKKLSISKIEVYE